MLQRYKSRYNTATPVAGTEFQVSDLPIVVLLFLLLVICPCASLVAPLNRYATRGWAARQGLPVRPEDLSWITHRRTARALSFAAGAVAGLLATLPARLAVPALAQPPLQVWSWAVLAIIGGAVALAGHALRSSRPRGDRTLRVAHSSAPQLTDYISPRVLVTTRALVGLSALAALVSALLPVWRGTGLGVDESGPVWVGLAVLLSGWVFAELVGRRIVAGPQPEVDPLDLAWNDAVRSEQVRDAFSVPISLSIVAAGLAALPADSAVPGPSWTLVPTMALLAWLLLTLVLALVLAAVSVVPVTSRRRAAVLATARQA